MSSSSRWRRFAFFDRSTLSLPDEVLRDLDLSPRSRSKHARGNVGARRDERRGEEGFSSTDEEEGDDDGDAAVRAGRSDRISLTVSSVGFHPSSVAARGGPDAVAGEDASIVAGGVATATNPAAVSAAAAAAAATGGGGSGDGTGKALSLAINELTCGVVPANGGAMLALRNAGCISPLNSSLAFVYPSPPPSSRGTSGGSSTVAKSPTRAVLDRFARLGGFGGFGADAATTTLSSGTLVLAFVSSKNTGSVHCVDVSMRCNPPPPPPTPAIPAPAPAPAVEDGGPPGPAVEDGGDANMHALATDLTSLSTAASVEELEDLDGWRGCVSPFFSDSSSPQPPSSSAGPGVAAGAGAGGAAGPTGGEQLSARDRIIRAHTQPDVPTTKSLSEIMGGGGGGGGGGGDPSSGEARAPRPPRIVGLASATTLPDPTALRTTIGGESNNPKTASAKGGAADPTAAAVGHLFLAAVTDRNLTAASGGAGAGVALLVDPHLHLLSSSSSSPQSSAAAGGSGMTIYRPSRNSLAALLAYGGQGQQQPASAAATIKQQRVELHPRYRPTCVDVSPHLVAVGTRGGAVLVYTHPGAPPAARPPPPAKKGKNVAQGRAAHLSAAGELQLWMEIPPPNGEHDDATHSVGGVRLAHEYDQDEGQESDGRQRRANRLYVTYKKKKRRGGRGGAATEDDRADAAAAAAVPTASGGATGGGGDAATVGEGAAAAAAGAAASCGVSCYNLIHTASGGGGTGTASSDDGQYRSVPRARVDLDSREAGSSALSDVVDVGPRIGGRFRVAWPDGLYTYSSLSRVGAVPIDGTKIAMCCLPPSTTPHGEQAGGGGVVAPWLTGAARRHEKKETQQQQQQQQQQFGSSNAGYSLVATTDSKSGRDAVDVYDTINKLVAFHVLLSPNHRALRVVGLATPSTLDARSCGRSSAVVLTSGGAVVTLTEKDTSDKVTLLVQKNLYAAAISLAFADSRYPISDIISLYRSHAEHLYRKGDFEASMEQYIYTIGSLEPSHVIFRFLDAPKIPLLATYLESLRQRNLATDVHNDLLRTCYLKLNDTVAAEKLATSAALSSKGSSAIANLWDKPAEALATLCSLEAPQVAEALSVHGATLARALPRETAGIVMSLCDGTYSPNALEGTGGNSDTSILENNLFLENRPKVCEMYPVTLFTSAFLENPRLLRLILAHCKRNKCELSPSLRRTHLELTLEEWKSAQRKGDFEMEKIRADEAMAALTYSHAEELGDYEALVIVQMAGFAQGEVLLYERLQMAPMLLERYAKEGGERERRQMLAMCRSDPELLADVLGYFVALAGEKSTVGRQNDEDSDDDSEGEAEEILEDIQEALDMARSQAVLPAVRVTRILAGEGVGQFSNDAQNSSGSGTSVPLSVALDYVGGIMDESSGEISRLKEEVEEYNTSCAAMEAEIDSLLSIPFEGRNESKDSIVPSVNIQQMYAKLRDSIDHGVNDTSSPGAQEEFWREMGHSEDRFETITRFFGKGMIQ